MQLILDKLVFNSYDELNFLSPKISLLTRLSIKIELLGELMPSAFETAIRKNKAEEVHNFLIGGRPLPMDIPNKASQTGLMVACAFGACDVVQELLFFFSSSL